MRERVFLVLGGVLFLVLAALTAFFYADGRVEFADRGLEEAVRDALGKPQGVLRRLELRDLRVLEAGGRDIKNLEGIESLVNLKALDLVDNRVGCVAPLGRLSSLEELSLRNNGILDLDALNFAALQGLPKLRTLSLRHNVVRFADASQMRLSDIRLLGDFTGLQHLELRDNHIEDIRPLSRLGNLETLDISQNPLTGGDLSPLAGLTGLTSLNLRETGAGDLSPLENLEGLHYLNLHSNEGVRSIRPLARLTELRVLILRNVPVGEEVDVLAALTNLHRLKLRNCGVRDVQPLGALMARGALQDRPGTGIEAEVDIRDNPIPEGELSGVDGYGPLRPYWENISGREPVELPPEG